ncbi:MAG: hypothetical protein IPH66_15875 [Crocinitomicaceae bacterium]|nr:hypothetical protein [Crocinitomicaceae bacterium]
MKSSTDNAAFILVQQVFQKHCMTSKSTGLMFFPPEKVYTAWADTAEQVFWGAEFETACLSQFEINFLNLFIVDLLRV